MFSPRSVSQEWAGGGESHGWFLGENVTKKRPSGIRAREGIQDNVKPDSGENRPALSFLTTSTLASPSTGFPCLAEVEEM